MLIMITGGSCAGKTTLAEVIKAKLLGKGISCATLSTDLFYRELPFGTMPREHNFDSLEAIDMPLLQSFCQNGGKSPFVFTAFDYRTHSRTREMIIPAADVVILEGIFSLASEKLQELASCSIFVDAPVEVRYRRRLDRYTKQLGHSKEMVDFKFYRQAELFFERHVKPVKESCDFVISGTAQFEEEAEKLIPLIVVPG